MQVVNIGEWVLEIDPIKTQMLSIGFNPKPSTDYERFLKICNNLKDDEYSVFKRLGLDPKMLRDFKSYDLHDQFAYYGNYYIYGKYLKVPPQDVITAEELHNRNFEYNFHNISIKAGRFKFTFQYSGHLIHSIPADLPKNCICLSFELWDKNTGNTGDGSVC